MLRKTFARNADLLQPALRIVRFAFEDNQRSRQLVGHFCAAVFQLILTPA